MVRKWLHGPINLNLSQQLECCNLRRTRFPSCQATCLASHATLQVLASIFLPWLRETSNDHGMHQRHRRSEMTAALHPLLLVGPGVWDRNGWEFLDQQYFARFSPWDRRQRGFAGPRALIARLASQPASEILRRENALGPQSCGWSAAGVVLTFHAKLLEEVFPSRDMFLSHF